MAVDHIDQAVELDATSTSVSTRGPDTEMFGVGRSVGGSKPERPESNADHLGCRAVSVRAPSQRMRVVARNAAQLCTSCAGIWWSRAVRHSAQRGRGPGGAVAHGPTTRGARILRSLFRKPDLTVGGCHVWSRIGCLAQYLRVNSEKGPSGAGSQFASRSVPGDPAPAYNVSEPRSPR